MVEKKPILVLCDERWPYEGAGPDPESLAAAGWIVVDAASLGDRLDEGAGCFVNLHGPYFPIEAWPALKRHLRRGGGWVNLGGAPFRRPVRGDGTVEAETMAYHEELNIHEALRVDVREVAKLAANPDVPLFQGDERLFGVEPTYGLILHPTRASEFPEEGGSAGPMDLHITPLMVGETASGRPIAAPAVLIENTKGQYAGGRWILVNQTVGESFWQDGGLAALRRWAEFAGCGVTELWVKPQYASYYPGERPTLTLQAQRIPPCAGEGGIAYGERPDRGGDADQSEWEFAFTLTHEAVAGDARTVWQQAVRLPVGSAIRYTRIDVPLAVEPGLYRLECEAGSSNGERRLYRQGFWGFDAAMLQEGSPLAADRDYFRKAGRPFPIVGMTYMTSDVARKYLWLPNAAVWDRDMARMKQAGINLLRSGIWTGYRQLMYVDGHPYEETLRAVDAFLLTAKRHGLEVTFNFFAFTPETWEGTNPYLDPRSVEAQKRFVTAIAGRHAKTANVQWDLINEPSMFDPRRIFRGPRTAGDRFEREAYVRWLRERHGSIEALRARWNMTPDQLPSFEAARPPEPDEINFGITDMSQLKKGLQWLDYALFANAMHNKWAGELCRALKAVNPHQLVTVGQDEALAGERPSPFFYAEAVDYTTVHSWWQNDDLIWDGIFTKAPDKPNVVQETGIMYVEQANNLARRSEQELRYMLERKYAYAFATGGAGAIHWIWNVNFYMDNINESNIGAVRADGTEKPEALVSYQFGAFMAKIGRLFEGRELEEIAAVFPYSNDYSNRKFAHDATVRMTRVLNYDLHVPLRGFGEYHLERLGDAPPRLILVPSAHNICERAMNRLLSHIREQGGVLYVSGPLHLNEYWQWTERQGLPGLARTKTANVVREHRLNLRGRAVAISFAGQRFAQALTEIPEDREAAAKELSEGASLQITDLGKGKLVWCPLPVELNHRTESLAALYEELLDLAGVRADLDWMEGGVPGIYGRKLSFAHGCLYIFVSEYGVDQPVAVRDRATGRSYRFLLEKERSVLFAADKEGRITAVYRPEEVEVSEA